MQLKQATSDSRKIISMEKQLLQQIFKAGYRYQQCGVTMGHIQPATMPHQTDLFALSENRHDRDHQLMLTMDNINQRFPKAIAVSATQMNRSWQTPVEHLSRHYTTN